LVMDSGVSNSPKAPSNVLPYRKSATRRTSSSVAFSRSGCSLYQQ
jgi:hypothetical protein